MNRGLPYSGYRLAILLVAALVAPAGCGGSGSRSTASGGALSRPELIAKADMICRRLDVALARTQPKRLSMHEIALLAPQRASLEHAAVTELSELTPPSSIASNWQQLILYRRTLAEELAELGRYAKANDTREIDALAASKKRVHGRLLAVATRDGFRYCGAVV